MSEIAGSPLWRVTFGKDGAMLGATPADVAADIVAANIDDLFVFAHGWNNDTAAAEDLFQVMFAQMAQLSASAPAPLANIGFVGVFWPSIWFPEPPTSSAGTVAAAVASGKPGQADSAVSGADIAAALTPAYDDPAQKAALASMGALVDAGIAAATAGTTAETTQQANVAAFHSQLPSIVSAPTQAAFDGGEASLVYAEDGQAAYTSIAAVMGSAPPSGDEQSIGSVFATVWNGAKDALRAASYLEMKTRAGTIGQTGLAPLLTALRAASATIRVHLIGHSFGARLVSFSVAGITDPADSPVRSLTLVQGAFSHWAFADATMPFGTPGPLLPFRDRIAGPVMSTFSSHDWAVGIWYPKASFLADDLVESEVQASKWGGMGADGAQCVPGPADPILLGPAGQSYDVAPGNFYRFDSNAIIADTSQSAFAGAHSDIRHPEVSWLPVMAARNAAGQHA